jgi:hypothetical protein
MTAYPLDKVREFVARLDEQTIGCDNGEGLERAKLDAAVRHYARLCRKFRKEVRQWGRAVFAGRVAYDAEVENAWLSEGAKLMRRAKAIYVDSQKSESSLGKLQGRDVLRAALRDLHGLLTGWVTPRLAVGPAARHDMSTTDPATLDEASRIVVSLPPLPADWQPDDPAQRAKHRRLRGS